jgi:hypothetical protein
VVELIASAPHAQKQAFFGKSLEIVPVIRSAQVTRGDFVILQCGRISQELRFSFRHVRKVRPEFLLF